MKKLKYLLLALLAVPFFTAATPTPKSQNIGDLTVISTKNSEKSDEFVSYWKNVFRVDEEGNVISICDISHASYLSMYEKYIALSDEDRTIVDKTPDYEEGYTIKDSIKELVTRFENTVTKESRKPTLTHSSTIIIVVSVAVFGMSIICVFFALKNKNIIK